MKIQCNGNGKGVGMSLWCTTEHFIWAPTLFCWKPSLFFYLPWNDWIHIIKHRGGEIFNVILCSMFHLLYNALTYLLSHRKKLHYNPLAAAMQYILIPSPCSMNMKYIMKHNNINRQYWDLPIHQCSTRWCLGCSLEQILQRWIQIELHQFEFILAVSAPDCILSTIL